MLKSFGRWLKWLPVVLLASILAYPLVPIFRAFGRGAVPRWLLTPDDPLPGGEYEPTVRAVYERWGDYVGDVYWLWRNRAHGLRSRVRFIPAANAEYSHDGPENVGDEHVSPFPAGVTYFEIVNPDGETAWEVYAALPYGPSGIGFRLRLGWKLQPYFRVHDLYAWTPAFGQYVFSINPFAKLWTSRQK